MMPISILVPAGRRQLQRPQRAAQEVDVVAGPERELQAVQEHPAPESKQRQRRGGRRS